MWNGQQTQGSQDPLIDTETFDKVQKMLKSKCTPKYAKHEYLFKGLFKCHECGGTVTWEEKKGIMYGHCNHYRKCTVRRWSKEKDMESKMVDEFGEFKIENPKLLEWLGKALKESNKNESEFYLDSVKQLEKQREVLKRRLDAIYMDKIDGKISEDYYNAKFKEFSKELVSIDKSIAGHTTATQSAQERRVKLYEVAQSGKEKYLDGNPDIRRELVKMAFCNLKLEDDKIFYDLEEDFALIKELAKKTNSSKLGKLIDSGEKIFEQYNLATASKYFASLEPECSAVPPNGLEKYITWSTGVQLRWENVYK